MKLNRPWDIFFKEKITKIFTEKKSVIDIGGGLRIMKEKNNRYDRTREWIVPYLEHVDYKVMDPVPDYHPDILGDIHHLPFPDCSQDAIVCIAVLEHVENPIKACQEIYRTLKPGGYCFLYVPFLFYYHAERGYYKDYWRFTKDAIEMLVHDFSSTEIQSVRGALETWFKISPLGRFAFINALGFGLDRLLGKDKSNQVSGYSVFLVK
ncbi:MAG: Methyltransf 11 protein [Candidatus Magasanikbacteria bacterium]|nr:Methyltransf 11 protein [Candidatus Magasanikbacteria bacterium]